MRLISIGASLFLFDIAHEAIYNARIGAENMTTQVKLVFVLTFVIHLISMLSYAVRMAG
jgi:hypothetical protein